MFKFFDKSLKVGESDLTIGGLLLFLVAILVFWIITKIATRLLYNLLRKKNVENGKVFSIVRIIKFVLYVLFFIIALQFLNLKPTWISTWCFSLIDWCWYWITTNIL